MTACSVAMPSYTYAMKGERMLRSRGYPCEIMRNEKTARAGCGYSLIIGRGCADALKILKSYSIPYTEVSIGGE